MSESRTSNEFDAADPVTEPCLHCKTDLPPEVRFCFECGAPVVPSVAILAPDAQASQDGLETGECFEIESLGFEVVVEEVLVSDPEDVGDPLGTVVAMAPERPLPFWPAPPKGNTVVAPPPKRSSS